MFAHHRGLIHHLHRLLPAVSADSDVELLDLYVRMRDERAFATLVHRHGAMVLGVCNRIVGNLQTAEDAYQATFLALARHAGSIRRPAALAAWLYGTAQRIAWKACAAAARRTPAGLPSDAQTPADPRPDPLSQVTAREALAILDEEVQRLPEVYRVAVILCCLDGKTLEQAAQQLGCTTGALRGRLERGRARLHARLVGRGLTLATALATAELARGTAAAGVAAATIRAALAFAANGTATAEISAEAARLAGEVAGCTAVTKAKLVAALLLVLGLATVGVSAATLSMFSDPPVQITPAGEWAVLPDEPPDHHVDRLGDPPHRLSAAAHRRSYPRFGVLGRRRDHC